MKRHAFTLLEVLITLGIFVIGFAMAAAIFPAAMLLQKKTIDEANMQQFARNVDALMSARPFVISNLNAEMTTAWGAAWDTDGQVYPMPPVLLAPPVDASRRQWSLRDRAYKPTAPGSAPASLEDDHWPIYFVPLVQDSNTNAGQSWRAFAFLVQKSRTADYTKFPGIWWANPSDPASVPCVRMIAVAVINQSTFAFNDPTFINDRQIVPGDSVLDNTGTIYSVIASREDAIDVDGVPSSTAIRLWVAPHAGGSATACVRIMLIPVAAN